jgi:hypothetical protein
MLVLRASTLGTTDRVHQARWVVSIRTSDLNHAVAGVRSAPGENVITRNERRSEAVGTDKAKGERLRKNRNEGPIVSVARRGVATERAVDDTANAKANVQVAKEGNDLLASPVSLVSPVNRVKPSLIAVRVTTADHQDQDVKNATDAAGVEV